MSEQSEDNQDRFSENAEADADSGLEDINDSDIVFDCPYCNNTLVIDYRGAGLPITCVKCGKQVLVPIPDGMDLKDLDLEPGDILKQLFKARRDLLAAEVKIRDLTDIVHELEFERNESNAEINAIEENKIEVLTLLQKVAHQQQELADILKRAAEKLIGDNKED